MLCYLYLKCHAAPYSYEILFLDSQVKLWSQYQI